jgi:cardiolipin synthase
MNSVSYLAISLHLLVEVALIVRVLLRPHRQPASRIAWIVVIISLPVVGIIAYLLFGETSIGRRRVARMQTVLDALPVPPTCDEVALQKAAEPYQHLFRLGQSISGFQPVRGNSAQLMADSNAAIDAMIEDIDAAIDHVHLLFYIWLPDTNGCKIVEALKRAAKRGIQCRAMADGLGSRLMIHQSKHWQAMRAAGVQLAVALPIGNPLLRPLRGRIDLRNHRKIVIIDGRITYCGSQNCADPEFRIKAKYAPWVDIMIRFEGPIAGQNQRLFAADWMSSGGDDLHDLLRRPIATPGEGFSAQVVGTGPTVRHSAMPEMFESLMYAAHRELVVTTPYYVPDEAMQSALCSTAYRGVKTTIVFPARNDSWIVAGASRSYYADLLAAGVNIFEFSDGLLHAKTLTVDGELSLIGSANMDRRSFELNYENNILLVDQGLTRQIRRRQKDHISCSEPVRSEDVLAWPLKERLRNNALAMLSPIL